MEPRPTRPRPVILFYNQFFDYWPDTSALPCRDLCEFTNDPARLSTADAVVIHIPTLRNRRRLMKYPGQLWVAWSMESNVNYPQLADPAFMRHFDLTMTYERSSDVPQSYRPRAFEESARRPVPAKTATAPAVLFQSAGNAPSGRDALCRALMQRLRVDSFGKSANNRTLPVPDGGHATKLATIATYKFTLAFENSIARDYVTEKFYDPLMAGSVPVYLGAPNIADFAPGDHCFINAADFSDAAALAKYLNFLDADDEAYRAYHAWRGREFLPQFLSGREISDHSPLCRLAGLVVARARGHRRLGRPVRPFARWRVVRDRTVRWIASRW
jgi:hypothetical protein